MQTDNLAEVCQIAEICHPDFPEDKDVLAEKLKLAPDFCFVYIFDGAIAGYVLAHPYPFLHIPALNALLHKIPINSDVLYLHDCAILPKARAYGAGRQAVALLVDCAKQHGFKKIALVAVNGSLPFWSKQMFVPYNVTDKKMDMALYKKLKNYSRDACYMTRSLI